MLDKMLSYDKNWNWNNLRLVEIYPGPSLTWQDPNKLKWNTWQKPFSTEASTVKAGQGKSVLLFFEFTGNE